MKIKEFKCRGCQHDDFKAMANPNNHNVIGIYCSRCGKWFKWADKDEKNLIKLAEGEVQDADSD